MGCGGMMGNGGGFGGSPFVRERRVRLNARPSEAEAHGEDPETTLKRRLARGEITVEEYQQILSVIRGA